jgi:Xaa-Pro aminopeptidase
LSVSPVTEFSQKQELIQALLAERKLDALLLQRVSSFAWATCGAASYVNTATTNGEAALLITSSQRYLITNNIEAPRLEQEEKLAAQGWEFLVVPWHEALDTVSELTRGLKLGADGPYPGAVDLSGNLARLRANLTPEEGERFRVLGRLCAEAMDSAVRAVRPGQTEHQIAGLLAHEAERRGVQAIVNLIATDERVFAFRHPLPTDKELECYAMLVLCGRRWGLVCSVTRLVHFGQLPDDLRHKAEAVARVDAMFIATTCPGRSLSQIFRRAAESYAEAGFPREWHLHHQGGPAGYEPREYVATPHSADVVSVGQAYAWNPSIAGTKSEDTILVGDESNEVLTAIENWPMLWVTVDGREIARPAILEIL